MDLLRPPLAVLLAASSSLCLSCTGVGVTSTPLEASVDGEARERADAAVDAASDLRDASKDSSAGLDYLSAITEDPTLIAFWRMDEAAGAQQLVDQKSSFNAQIGGGVTLGAASTYLAGDTSTAATFDREAGAHATIGDVSALDVARTASFSLSAIVTPDVTQSDTNYWLYTKALPSSPYRGLTIGLKRTSASRQTCLFFQLMADYPSQAIRLLGDCELRNGRSYLVGVTYDGSGAASGVRMYMDGRELSSYNDAPGVVSGKIDSGQDTSSKGNAAELGRWGAMGQSYQGDLKDVAVFRAAKPSSWMSALRLASGSEPALTTQVSYAIKPGSRPQVFYDFDLDSDIDDVVDAVVLLNLERGGELDIVGAVSTSGNPYSAAAWMAIANFYGRRSIATGVNTSAPGNGGSSSLYDQKVADSYGVPGRKTAGAFESYLATQRRALASAADSSIQYVTTGDLSSVKGLLESPPDEFSNLTGVELVARKVGRIWVVAGFWPSGPAVSDLGSNPAISSFVLTHWPTSVPMILVDLAAGETTCSGQDVMEKLPHDNPARYAWELFFDGSSSKPRRPAWAQIAFLTIARGVYPHSASSVDYARILGESGTGVVNPNGATSWDYSRKSNHGYLYKLAGNVKFVEDINSLIR